MYTQCPDCSEVFRVTADILRLAGGRVRCGVCGAAFDALHRLSEHRPPAAAAPAARQLPELRPESDDTAPEPPDDTDAALPFGKDDEAGDDEAPAAVVEPTRDAPQPLSGLELDLDIDDPDEWRDLLAEVGSAIANEPPAKPSSDGDEPEIDRDETGHDPLSEQADAGIVMGSDDALHDAATPERHEHTPEIPAAVVDEARAPAARNWRAIGGAAALGLLLALQAVHFSRHTLASVPVLFGVLEPVYARFGQTLHPAWNVTGWHFEAMRGRADPVDETLTIHSRIGNDSDAALPYPAIGVALTNRFEETIGSRVFAPADYLGQNADSARLVPAGTAFNAAMVIESPPADAMGFKLKVCYRQPEDRLRCAAEDFRN